MGCAPKVRFAPDIPLEGAGFEPSVPLAASEGEVERAQARKTLSLLRGTEGSNPPPSSGESRANLSLAGIRLPTSRSRGFPRVCGSGRAARSAETRRTRQHRAYGR